MLKKIINKIKNNNKREITSNITIEKANQILCVTIFLSIIIVMPLFTFARGKNDYIYYENRLASSMPKMQFSTLLDGKYMQDFEEYFSDILFLRNRFLIMNVIYEKYLMNKDVVNNIIIDKTNLLAYHGYDDLFESVNDKYCYQSAMRVKKLLDALNKDNIPFYYIGIPQQMSYLASKYPKYYYNGEYHFDSLNKTFSKDLENIGANFINIREYFNSLDQTENEKNDMYYHTDHHYTFIAAYKVYEKIINTLNSDNNVLLKIKNNENLEKKLFMYNEKDIEFKYLPNTFVGSLGRKLTNRFDRGISLLCQ